jgi:hypothetical protein
MKLKTDSGRTLAHLVMGFTFPAWLYPDSVSTIERLILD